MPLLIELALKPLPVKSKTVCSKSGTGMALSPGECRAQPVTCCLTKPRERGL